MPIKKLNLFELKRQSYVPSERMSDFLAEAASVCLENQSHPQGVQIKVTGAIETTVRLDWEQELKAERMIRFALLGNLPKPITQELHGTLKELQVKQTINSPLEKYQQLLQNLQKEVADFIDFLIMKHNELTASL